MSMSLERQELSSAYDMAIEACGAKDAKSTPTEEVYYGFGVFMGVPIAKLKELREEMQKRNNTARFQHISTNDSVNTPVSNNSLIATNNSDRRSTAINQSTIMEKPSHRDMEMESERQSRDYSAMRAATNVGPVAGMSGSMDQPMYSRDSSNMEDAKPSHPFIKVHSQQGHSTPSAVNKPMSNPQSNSTNAPTRTMPSNVPSHLNSKNVQPRMVSNRMSSSIAPNHLPANNSPNHLASANSPNHSGSRSLQYNENSMHNGSYFPNQETMHANHGGQNYANHQNHSNHPNEQNQRHYQINPSQHNRPFTPNAHPNHGRDQPDYHQQYRPNSPSYKHSYRQPPPGSTRQDYEQHYQQPSPQVVNNPQNSIPPGYQMDRSSGGGTPVHANSQLQHPAYANQSMMTHNSSMAMNDVNYLPNSIANASYMSNSSAQYIGGNHNNNKNSDCGYGNQGSQQSIPSQNNYSTSMSNLSLHQQQQYNHNPSSQQMHVQQQAPQQFKPMNIPPLGQLPKPMLNVPSLRSPMNEGATNSQFTNSGHNGIKRGPQYVQEGAPAPSNHFHGQYSHANSGGSFINGTSYNGANQMSLPSMSELGANQQPKRSSMSFILD